MADSTHTLELELRTKDFASANLKRVGEEGKKAGEQIKGGMSSASGGVESFSKTFLSLDPSFKKVATAGLGAMSSINAAITTASASSENLGRAALGSATSIVAGFASGGPVGGALAAAAAGIGLLVNLFNDVDEASQKAAASAVAAAEGTARGAEAALGSMQERLARLKEETQTMLGVGPSEQQKELARIERERVRTLGEIDDKIAQAQRRYEDINKNLRENKDLTVEQRNAERVAQEQYRETIRVLREQRVLVEEIAKAGVAKANAAAAKAAEDAAAATRKQGEAQDKVLKASREALEAEARRLGLSREQLEILDLQAKYLEAVRLGSKEAAEAFKAQILALKEKQQVQQATDKASESSLDRQLDKTRKIRDEAKQAGDDRGRAKAGRAPAPAAAAAAAEGLAIEPELGLADARQARRDALRAMKRRRAAGARTAFVGGRIPGMRSGRRRGGLGAFSGLFTPEPMGIGEPLPSPDDPIPPMPLGGPLPAGAGAGAGLPGGAAGGAAGGVAPRAPGAITPSAQAATAALQAQTAALKEVASEIDAMKKAADEGKGAADEASTSSSSAADALKATAESLSGVADSMAAAATSARDLGTTVSRLQADVTRLKEAVNLRGGN